MAEPLSAHSELLRFVVLHHTGVDQAHYDFMFETSSGSELVTFRLERWPVRAGEPATRLGEHRREYLDYVGPISGGRGRVDRVAQGRARVESRDEGWVLRGVDGHALISFVQDSEQWMTGSGTDPVSA